MPADTTRLDEVTELGEPVSVSLSWVETGSSSSPAKDVGSVCPLNSRDSCPLEGGLPMQSGCEGKRMRAPAVAFLTLLRFDGHIVSKMSEVSNGKEAPHFHGGVQR